MQITLSGSNKLARPGLNTPSARTKGTTAILAATQIIALNSHSYVRVVQIRISPRRTDGTSCLVHARGSILLLDFSYLIQIQPTTPATTTLAHRTGFALMLVISTQRSIKVQLISRKCNTRRHLNTNGVRRIPGSATCITTLPIVSSLLAAQRASHFPQLARPRECTLPSRLGQAQR